MNSKISIDKIEFGVSYDTDLEKLNKLMTAFVDEIDGKYIEVIEKPSFLGITELADSSINMLLIAKTKSMQHFQVERDIRKDLVEYFVKNNIEIPFPQVVVHNA